MVNQSIGAMDCCVTVQESRERLTSRAVLPLIVQVMKWTVLLPVAKIPPPCTVELSFSGFTKLHWGDGLLRNSQRFECGSSPGPFQPNCQRFKAERSHDTRLSACDFQSNQLDKRGGAADVDHTPLLHGVQHHCTRHCSLDCAEDDRILIHQRTSNNKRAIRKVRLQPPRWRPVLSLGTSKCVG